MCRADIRPDDEQCYYLPCATVRKNMSDFPKRYLVGNNPIPAEMYRAAQDRAGGFFAVVNCLDIGCKEEQCD